MTQFLNIRNIIPNHFLPRSQWCLFEREVIITGLWVLRIPEYNATSPKKIDRYSLNFMQEKYCTTTHRRKLKSGMTSP